eukprot:gnl/MRDRNA2_/MRDRNA2_79351_c0_seq2.p1 gnl/MRDRNA2_/MRDRNA2_79351_c0~~gnl/MRDRNA2_/MRDRNA2_79351_c0_seq2.p1  ORF type:complete len:239 (-),score=79.84 gnl/MRDRNA2_/MRDRNA2_79351_c0_seq2:259-975(-)
MAMIHMNRFSALDDKFKVPANGKATEKPKVSKVAPSSVATLETASVSPDNIKCSRCGRVGHYAKDCKLPFTRDLTKAEMRMKREAEKAGRMAEKEARQAEYEKKKSAWTERQAKKSERSERKAVADQSARSKAMLAKDWDAQSDISLVSTAVSAACTLTSEQEVEVQALVAKDKEVRRLQKLLREIAKLEQSADLDILQQKKINRKSELELALETASGLAAACARNQVRQSVLLNGMD